MSPDLPRRRWLARTALALALPVARLEPARAQAAEDSRLPPELRGELPAAQRRSQARMRYFGLSIYDARLWSPAPVTAENALSSPLALELIYTRSLQGRRIAERSLEEMQRQEPIEPAQAQRWVAQMQALFPDVQDGDRLTGVHRPGELARFFFNGRLTGEVRDARFARLFFGIWLSPQTSEPALRQQLLGGSR